MELISSCELLVKLRVAQLIATYSSEDLFALELVQLRRRLLEVETRLVTGSCHVCAVVKFTWKQRSKKVGDLRSPKLAPVGSAPWPTRVS